MGRQEYKVFWGLELGEMYVFAWPQWQIANKSLRRLQTIPNQLTFFHVVRCIGSLLDRCPCYTVVEHYAETASI